MGVMPILVNTKTMIVRVWEYSDSRLSESPMLANGIKECFMGRDFIDMRMEVSTWEALILIRSMAMA